MIGYYFSSPQPIDFQIGATVITSRRFDINCVTCSVHWIYVILPLVLSTTQSILQRSRAAYTVSSILPPREQNNSLLWPIFIHIQIFGNAAFYRRKSKHHNTTFVARNKSRRDTERYATVTSDTFTAANLYRTTKVICVVYDALTLPPVLFLSCFIWNKRKWS